MYYISVLANTYKTSEFTSTCKFLRLISVILCIKYIYISLQLALLYNCNYLFIMKELPQTVSGCCRSEPFSGRKPTEMFSFIDSRYRKRPVGIPRSVTGRDEDLTQISSRYV